MRRAPLLAAMAMAAATVWPVGATAEELLLRLSDKRVVSLASAVADLRSVPITIIGESHAEPSHHEAQLAVIGALHEAEVDFAIGLEMFRADSQGALDAWVDGRISRQLFVEDYYDNWSFSFSAYEPIFTYAREHRIPLVGLNVPDGVVTRFAREGAKALDPETAAALGGVACVVDDAYRAFMRRVLRDHGARGAGFERFCTAQVFWDAVMAVRVIRHLRENPGRAMVVLAGQGHAWRHGIPAQIRVRGGPGSRVILPTEAGFMDGDTAGPAEADYLWLFR